MQRDQMRQHAPLLGDEGALDLVEGGILRVAPRRKRFGQRVLMDAGKTGELFLGQANAPDPIAQLHQIGHEVVQRLKSVYGQMPI